MLATGKTTLLVILSMSLTLSNTVAFAKEPGQVGLLEAVRIALSENPKIRANDKTLEAMTLRVEALKMSRYPSIHLGASSSFDNGSTYDGFQSNSYNNRSTSKSASLNWTVYDGGALKNRIESAKCSFKERQASFNSTNTMMRNTQGQIASVVVENYVSLVEARENIKFTESLLQILSTLRSAAKSQGEILEVENFISNLTLNLEQLKAEELKAARNYEYVVTEAAPTNVESFQSMIDSLIIPKNPDEALQIALEKSPEIKTARYQIDCNRLEYKSAKASAYSPKVSLSVGYDRSNQNLSGSGYNSQGASVGISIRMNLDPGSSSELKAQRKEIDSAQENLDGTIADTKHDLDSNYPDLQNSIRFADLHNQNFMKNQAIVQQYLQDIADHKSVSVSDALKQVSNMTGSWHSHSREVSRVLNKKFQIQKSVGTLFENLGMQDSEMNRVNIQ